MKKLGGITLVVCIAAALVNGPAHASEGVSPLASDTVCRDFFSDTVCDVIETGGGPVQTIRELAENPPGADELRRTIQYWVECVLYQSCIGRDSDGARGTNALLACREVFSDRVCSQIEDPVGTAQWVYEQFLQCYLDPTCTPTPEICIGPPTRPIICLTS